MNQIIQGDAIEEMAKLPDESIDAVICDPPYGTTACKWDTIIPFEPMWEQLKRITKKNGAIVLFGSQPFTSALVMSNPKMFKYEWVWEKTKASGHLDAKRKPMRIHENIIVFGDNGFPKYIPQGLKEGIFKTGRNVDMSGKVYSQYKNHGTSAKGNYPKTIIKVSNPSGKGHFHPTQKPVALLEYLVKTYTNEGETVLDFTAGSGTTGIACINLNRNFIGIEISPKYYEIAKERIKNTLAQKKLF